MEKRESCRAIVITNNELVVMYRNKEGRIYYTFPGGGRENNETLNECMIRECVEEFGIIVEPLREIYYFEDEKSIQHFFVCKWISGELGSGTGEEFQPDRNRGVYKTTTLKLNEIEQSPLVPSEIKEQILKDVKKYGTSLNIPCKNIVGGKW